MQKGFDVVNLHGTASGVIAVPVIGENGNWYIGNDDTGAPARGKDGTPPHIGENGNWFIGDTDTGVTAQGPKGEPGEAGPAGAAAEKVYSTEEHRSGTWIDGNPIYERTYPVYNVTGSCKLAEAIENIDRVVNIGGFADCYFENSPTRTGYWTWPVNTAVIADDPRFLEVYYIKVNQSISESGIFCNVKFLPNEKYKNIFVTIQYTKVD